MIEAKDVRYLTEESVLKKEVMPIRKTTVRGTLVKRVTSRGDFLNTTVYLVTGAKFSGTPNIDYVHVRELVLESGKYRIPNGSTPMHFEPDITVVKVGEIDYLDQKNREFFAPLGIGF